MSKILNHPVMVVKNVIGAGALIVMVGFFLSLNGHEWAGIAIPLALIAAVAFFAYYRTRVTLELLEDHALVESRMLINRTITIPYGMIASVNLNRSILDRVFQTSTLSINLNSSVNATEPEASFVLESGMAERLRIYLSSGLTAGAMAPEPRAEEPINRVSFTVVDSLMYGIFGLPTGLLALSAVLLAYSAYSAMFDNAEGAMMAIMFLMLTEGVSLFTTVIRYADLEVYRSGTRIYLKHGMVQTFATNFDASKINAIRIRRPLMARLMGRACLEAEVVGLSSEKERRVPVLTLLVKESELPSMMALLVPEFIEAMPRDKQPRSAIMPLLIKAGTQTLAIAIVVALCAWAACLMIEDDGGVAPVDTAMVIAIVMIAIAAALLLALAFMRRRVCELGLGVRLFSIVNGVVDREEVQVMYDRVQVFSRSAWPTARRLGLSRGRADLLSTQGKRSVTTGYFADERLDRVHERMAERLRTGECDPLRNII